MVGQLKKKRKKELFFDSRTKKERMNKWMKERKENIVGQTKERRKKEYSRAVERKKERKKERTKYYWVDEKNK